MFTCLNWPMSTAEGVRTWADALVDREALVGWVRETMITLIEELREHRAPPPTWVGTSQILWELKHTTSHAFVRRDGWLELSTTKGDRIHFMLGLPVANEADEDHPNPTRDGTARCRFAGQWRQAVQLFSGWLLMLLEDEAETVSQAAVKTQILSLFKNPMFVSKFAAFVEAELAPPPVDAAVVEARPASTPNAELPE